MGGSFTLARTDSLPTSSRSPFLDIGQFPQLGQLTDHFHEVREEALSVRSDMVFIQDERAGPNTWSVMPFQTEEEDRSVIGDEMCAHNRRLAARTVAMIDAISGVRASAFSSLAAGATIGPHSHEQPNVTATLCLLGGGSALISVGRETRPFIDGQWTVFDYTHVHSVTNAGTMDRIVLLLAFANPDRALFGRMFRESSSGIERSGSSRNSRGRTSTWCPN